MVSMKQVIVADSHIKQVPCFDAGWIRVVVLLAWSWDADSR